MVAAPEEIGPFNKRTEGRGQDGGEGSGRRGGVRTEGRGRVYTFHRFNLLWSTIKIET